MAAHARNAPDRVALRDGDDVVRYGALGDRAARLASVFVSLGVQDGGAVAAMVPNSAAFFETAAAACRAEQHFLPVNWHLKSEELAWILADSGARVLVADVALADHVEPALAHAPDCRLLWVGDGYEEAIGSAEPLPGDGWGSPAFIFYTSGTTGRPKGVVHSGLDPSRMHATQEGLAAMWGFRPDDVYLLAGPAYHAGPGGYAFTTLFVGGAVSIMREWSAAGALAQIERDRATVSFLTPAHFIRILELPEAERRAYDLSSFRLIIHGGAPCPVPVKRAIIEALPDAEVWELYGASEGGATRVSPSDWLARPGTVGLPWPGVEIRVCDASGAPCPPGDAGVIYIAPPGARERHTFHYHGDDDKTAAAWRDGAFTVGDIGYLDDHGWLYITDRVSDMVIRDGVNVYPREIEDMLFRHPAVVDCAVFGVPDARHGEVLHAVVESRAPVTVEDLVAFCREHLADYKCPAAFRFVDELPRDPNGKVMKRHLRAEATTAVS